VAAEHCHSRHHRNKLKLHSRHVARVIDQGPKCRRKADIGDIAVDVIPVGLRNNSCQSARAKACCGAPGPSPKSCTDAPIEGWMAKLGMGQGRNAVKKAGLVMAFIGVGLAGSECITDHLRDSFWPPALLPAEEDKPEYAWIQQDGSGRPNGLDGLHEINYSISMWQDAGVEIRMPFNMGFSRCICKQGDLWFIFLSILSVCLLHLHVQSAQLIDDRAITVRSGRKSRRSDAL